MNARMTLRGWFGSQWSLCGFVAVLKIGSRINLYVHNYKACAGSCIEYFHVHIDYLGTQCDLIRTIMDVWFRNIATTYEKDKHCRSTEWFHILLMHNSTVGGCFRKYAFIFSASRNHSLKLRMQISRLLPCCERFATCSLPFTLKPGLAEREGEKNGFLMYKASKGMHEMNCVKC